MFNIPIKFKTAEEMQAFLSQEAMSQFPLVVDKVVPLADLGIEPRVFFHWKEKGIVEWHSTISGQRQRIKLNLFEVIWVKIVKDLRNLGLAIPDILVIKKQLHSNVLAVFKEIDVEKLLETFKNDSTQTEYDFMLNAIQNFRKQTKELEESAASMSTFLGGLIIGVIVLKQRINILLVKDNEILYTIVEGNLNTEKNKEQIEIAKSKSHINIPLNNLLEEFIEVEANEKYLQRFGLLSKTEMEILDCIKNNDVREITIKKDQDNNITLTAKKGKKLNETESGMIRSILAKNDFTEIRVVKRNHKEIFVEGTMKKKLPAENG